MNVPDVPQSNFGELTVMAQVQAQTLCIHRHYLNNGIHKLVLQDDSSAAVDAAIAHMNDILDDHDPSETLHLLIDARDSGVPPLQYFFSSVRRMYSARKKLPPVRAAYLYQDNVLLALIQAFFDALRLALRMEGSRRFMQDTPEHEAIEWLLSDDDR